MNLIVDSNLIISALISPNGTIARLIFNKLSSFTLFAPHYLLIEVNSKKAKILSKTAYTETEFIELLQILIDRIEFVDEELIPTNIWQEAYQLTNDVDEKDTVFVALAKYLNLNLWTGDKALIKGLSAKGFNLLITAAELDKQL